MLISPEQVVTNYIKRLIEYPGALQVIDFAEGKAQLVAVKAYYGGALVGQQLRQLRAHMPNVDTRIAAIYRRDERSCPKAIRLSKPTTRCFSSPPGLTSVR